jgi:hypothetical protein
MTTLKNASALAEIRVHYEQQPEYPLTKREKAGEKLDYRVTKMPPQQRQAFSHLQPVADPFRILFDRLTP